MKRWHYYSPDPNSAVILAKRGQALARARVVQLVERVPYLCQLAAGRSVLDIGVVEHSAGAAEGPNWLHGHLRRHARRCVGVDILEPEINALRAKGFDVICTDISKEPLAERFELITAGELLEHLDAPGRFLQNCAAMLAPQGRLVITVPNPWYANVIAKNLFRGPVFVDSADHVAWYEPSVLYELAQRQGLLLDRFTGAAGNSARTFSGKVFFALRPLLLALGLRSELFAKSLICEFVRDG